MNKLTATIENFEHDGKIAQNRKESNFTTEYALIDCIEREAVMRIRVYWTNARAYACLWINKNPVYVSGGGYAGGYGYCKESAAIESAMNDAGIVLSESIGGRGITAIESAIHAIADCLGVTDYMIHKSHDKNIQGL